MQEHHKRRGLNHVGDPLPKHTLTDRPMKLPASYTLAQAYVALIRRAANVTEHQVLRLPEVVKKTGRAASTVWRDVKVGTFVPPIQIGVRAVGWLQHEIDAVLEARAFASRSGVALDVTLFVSLLTAARTAPEPFEKDVLEANNMTAQG
jgi:prophage regulatory protein